MSFLVTLPQAEIGLPSAPDNSGPVREDGHRGTCVDKKPLMRHRILEKNEAVEGVELPTAAV